MGRLIEKGEGRELRPQEESMKCPVSKRKMKVELLSVFQGRG
jgi:hypothetical protein